MATTPNHSPPLTSRAKGYAPPKSMLPWIWTRSAKKKHNPPNHSPEYLLKFLNELPLCICQGVPICSCYMLKALLFLNCAVHTPPDCRKDLQKMFFKKNQDLYIMEEIEMYCSSIQTNIHDLLLYFLHNANNAWYAPPVCKQSLHQSTYDFIHHMWPS